MFNKYVFDSSNFSSIKPSNIELFISKEDNDNSNSFLKNFSFLLNKKRLNINVNLDKLNIKPFKNPESNIEPVNENASFYSSLEKINSSSEVNIKPKILRSNYSEKLYEFDNNNHISNYRNYLIYNVMNSKTNNEKSNEEKIKSTENKKLKLLNDKNKCHQIDDNKSKNLHIICNKKLSFNSCILHSKCNSTSTINTFNTAFELNSDKCNKYDKVESFSINKTHECIICMMAIEHIDDFIYLKCHHSYHKKCIFKWLLRKPYCPMCNENMTHMKLDKDIILKFIEAIKSQKDLYIFLNMFVIIIGFLCMFSIAYIGLGK